MPTDAACGAVRNMADRPLTCELPPEHTVATDEQPQGSPHEDSSHLDTLTGDPWRWWG